MPRCPEAATGHRQYLPLLQLPHKGDVILQRGFGEHVKSPLGFYQRIAHIDKMTIQKISLLLILSHRDGHLLEVAHHMLHQSRGIDKSQRSVAEDKAVHQLIMLVTVRVYGDVANSLTG